MKKTDSLIEVSVENGRKIKTTSEHRFLILSKSGKFIEKRADDLSEKDVLVCARKLNYSALTITELKNEFLRTLGTEYNFYVNLKKELKNTIHKKVLGYGKEDVWKDINSKLKMDSFYNGVWRGQYRLKDLINLADFLKIDFNEIYMGILSLNYREAKRRGVHSSIALKLPHTLHDFEKLYYLSGVFFGDGSSGSISNKSEELQQKIEKFCKYLGIDVAIRKYGDKCPRIDVKGGLTLQKILNLVFLYPLKQKSHNISVSSFVEKSPVELIKCFIRGYFDTDGTIEKARSAVSITSVSKEMLEGLQLLLYKFDIGSIINENKQTLYISGRSSLEKFKEIGFSIKSKNNRFETLLNKSSVSKLEYIPINADILRNARKRLNLSQNQIFNNYRNYEIEAVGLSKTSLRKIKDKISAFGEVKELKLMNVLCTEDTTFLKVKTLKKSSKEDYVYDFTVEKYHNFVAEGFIIHNTTLTDNLLFRAGMISGELAGHQLFMDYDPQEQERGITIYAANVSMVHELDGKKYLINVSMVHELDGKKYLINLIDTPGHVDFGGDVTRAMRAVDGALVVVDAVEGCMPQTETVLRQALKEKVKPILFVNKVDRLIKELKLNPKEMQARFIAVIEEVNNLIRKMATKDMKEKWLVSVENGSVAFGTGLRNWAISIPFMKKTGITFKDIIDLVNEDNEKKLAEIAPLHEVVLNMVIKHLLDPVKAQEYRIPQIWKGDLESEYGKSMRMCDKNGKLVAVVTNVMTDQHAGVICTARLFSGTIKEGMELYGVLSHKEQRLQQVGVYSGPRKMKIDSVPAGNIVALTGVDYSTGETLVSKGEHLEPFERIEHMFEPVVTKSIEAAKTADLPKLVKALRIRAKEDSTIRIKINEETGETLVSGLGELHIEAKIERYLKDKGIEINVSKPIVVYRESVKGLSPEMEGKSPNRHNRFYFTLEPVTPEVYKVLTEGNLPEGKIRSQDKLLIRDKMQEAGMAKEDASRIIAIKGSNLIIDTTRGIQYLSETYELIIQAFESIIEEGPLAKEPCMGVLAKLRDAKLHEDAIHRGPAQVIPAVRESLTNGILTGGAKLQEPKQIIRIDTPSSELGGAIRELSNRRGQVLEMTDEEGSGIIKAKIPVAEMFGFEAGLKSATGGKGFYSLMDQVFEPLPEALQNEVVLNIRKRKGMKLEIPRA